MNDRRAEILSAVDGDRLLLLPRRALEEGALNADAAAAD